ncbi:MAG: proton-conducting transporter membrane subunit [Anaerolineaceae bacterium]|jgi:proton-translocating NADH-quinone oxidoreductase chain N
MIHLNFVWLVAFPLVMSPVIYLIGRIGNLTAAEPKRSNPAKWVCLVVMLLTFVPFVDSVLAYQNSGAQVFTLGVINLRLDGISLLLAGAVLFLSCMVTLFSGPYMAGEENEEKYYALLTALVGAMIGLGCADDLFNLWVWFELMAISTYLLVAFYHNLSTSLEAGVKYLVQSAAGSALVLLGIAIVLAQTGTLNLESIHAQLAQLPPGNAPLLAAGVLFLIGFGVKTALVPMHTWLPDAHSMAPSGVSAMLSGVVIETGLVAMIRALAALSPVSSIWGILLLAFGAVNMLVGNLMALRQKEVKRMLAYSSVAQMGYILVGLGVGFAFGNLNGLTGGFFHILNHSVMKGLAFLAAGSLLYSLYLAKGSHDPLMVDDLNGAAKRYPLVALTLSIAVIALGGLPPFAGFMSKWQIFASGFETHQLWVEILIVFAALNSVLSLGYYIPLINRMYRLTPSTVVSEGKSVPIAMSIPLVIMTLLVIAIGILPVLVNWLTIPAGASLFAFLGF